jgi:hypothetical protein
MTLWMDSMPKTPLDFMQEFLSFMPAIAEDMESQFGPLSLFAVATFGPQAPCVLAVSAPPIDESDPEWEAKIKAIVASHMPFGHAALIKNYLISDGTDEWFLAVRSKYGPGFDGRVLQISNRAPKGALPGAEMEIQSIVFVYKCSP